MARIFTEKICEIHGLTKYYLGHDNYYKCRLCVQAIQKDNCRRKKRKLIELLGGKCQLCGYNFCEYALEFHHIDRNKKEMEISKAIANTTFAKCLKEANKTILLCANCHREVENNAINIPDDIIDFRLNNEIKFEGSINKNIKTFYNKICKCCNKIFTTNRPTQNYCSINCKGGARKVNCIDKNNLIDDLKNQLTKTAMAIKYSVSFGTIKKWLEFYELK